MKTLEEKIGWLLKSGDDLDDQTYPEDPHFLFSNCGGGKMDRLYQRSKRGTDSI